MSRFEEFLNETKVNDELGAGMRKMFEDESISDKKQGLIDYGKTNGYEFTEDDMKAYSAKLNEEDAELSEDELDAVAGGSKAGAKKFFEDFSTGFRIGFHSMATSLGLCFIDSED